MKIIQMLQPVVMQGGRALLLGLGDDSKVYAWDTSTGLWKPNWDQPQPIAPQNRQARRAQKKGKK